MFEKQLKKMKMVDWALAKLGIISFVLFVFGVWPDFRGWILSVNPLIFLAVSVIALIIVQLRIWKK